MTRIDYFLVPFSMLQTIFSWKIESAAGTDHLTLELTIGLMNTMRGPGLWKLNCSLLKDPSYLEGVNKIILNFEPKPGESLSVAGRELSFKY